MATLTRKPRSSKSKSFACRLVSATIEINGTLYSAEPIDPHEEGTAAFRLGKMAGDGAVYDVVRDHSGLVRCDCPSYVSTHEGTASMCKHGRALVALGLVEVPKPVPNFVPVGPAATMIDLDTWNRGPRAEAPAPEPAACCPADEPRPCSACAAIEAEPAEPVVIPPAGLRELGIDPGDDDGPDDGPDDDGEPWRDFDVVGLGPMAEPIDLGARPLSGPSAADDAWRAGYDAGRASAEDELRDLYLLVSRLEEQIRCYRVDLAAVGR